MLAQAVQIYLGVARFAIISEAGDFALHDIKLKHSPMKLNQILLAASSLLAFSGAASAGAITWVDRDPNTGVGPLQYLSVGGTSTYSSTFDITTVGFVPGQFNIDSILVKFAFADNATSADTGSGSDGFEYVDISLGSVKIWNDLEVDGDHSNAPLSYDWYSQSLFGNATILGDLNADGILNYSVTIQDLSGSKNTYLKIAELTVTGDPKKTTTGQPVPDGGATLALLGATLMGLGVIRRKLL